MTYSVDPFIGSMILKGIIAAIIGGIGSLGGGVVAGLLLGVVESFLIGEIGASLTQIVIYSAICSSSHPPGRHCGQAVCH